MVAFVTFFCVLWIVGIAIGLARLADGRPIQNITRGQVAFIVFMRCIYVGWALWIIAQGVAHV